VEAVLQKRFQHLPLGSKRPWRYSTKGAKYLPELAEYKVFLSWSFHVTDSLKAGILKINY
jgi:hypothetical protein